MAARSPEATPCGLERLGECAVGAGRAGFGGHTNEMALRVRSPAHGLRVKIPLAKQKPQ